MRLIKTHNGVGVDEDLVEYRLRVNNRKRKERRTDLEESEVEGLVDSDDDEDFAAERDKYRRLMTEV